MNERPVQSRLRHTESISRQIVLTFAEIRDPAAARLDGKIASVGIVPEVEPEESTN